MTLVSSGFAWQAVAMRLALLTTLTMIAFAANSVLNRLALVETSADPWAFGAVRVAAGAVALSVILVSQGRFNDLRPRRVPWSETTSLIVYIFGFSVAYINLDAGVGALILFGTVQITMFAGAVFGRDFVPLARWTGAGLAFLGLVWLLWPRAGVSFSVLHVTSMVMAGIGWGVYSLAGRRSAEPLVSTAQNFVLAVPIGLALVVIAGGFTIEMRADAWGLAILSGAVTSGMGYALWYAILPKLGATRAAVAQLTVPVIALAGGMVLLAEPLTIKFGVAAILVAVGVLISLRPAKA